MSTLVVSRCLVDAAMARLTKRARKDLDRLPMKLSARAGALIRRLDNEHTLGQKLLGPVRSKRSARLGRTHRIIYTVVEENIVVMAIRARRDAYR